MVLFPADKASVVKGADNIQVVKTSEDLGRARCKASKDGSGISSFGHLARDGGGVVLLK